MCYRSGWAQGQPYRGRDFQFQRDPGFGHKPFNPERVLYVSAPSGFAGAERALVTLINGLVQSPHSVAAAALISFRGHFTEALEQAG